MYIRFSSSLSLKRGSEKRILPQTISTKSNSLALTSRMRLLHKSHICAFTFALSHLRAHMGNCACRRVETWSAEGQTTSAFRRFKDRFLRPNPQKQILATDKIAEKQNASIHDYGTLGRSCMKSTHPIKKSFPTTGQE